MDHKEIAMHLTMKAMETGLIPKKYEGDCKQQEREVEIAQCSAKLVNDFFQETLNRLNNK